MGLRGSDRLLDFNVETCCFLHIGKNNAHKSYNLPNRTNNTIQTLTEASAEYDLSIIMDLNLYIDTHINNITSNVNRILRRLKNPLTVEIKIPL